MEPLNLHHNITVVSLNNSNSTIPEDDDTLMALANQVLITIALALIMIGMGCTITLQEIWKNLKRPTGICICFLSQFGVMPLVAFGMAHLLQLSPYTAIGALIIACCPGGTVSNIFTYWTDGDVCLSICMTTCSTILAIGMMPLCLFAYSRSWVSAITVIPFVDIMLALVAILVPGAIGMLIKWKSEKVSQIVTKVCSALSLLLIIVITIILGISKPEIYRSEWKAWLLTSIYPLLAFSFGFLVASLFRLPYKKRRTIAFETGCQNVALALTVINISFPSGQGQLQMLIVPILYSLFLFIDSLLIIMTYVLISRFCCKKKREENKEIVDQPDVIVQEKEPVNCNDGNVNRGFDDKSPVESNGIVNPGLAPVLVFNPETLDVDYGYISNRETQTTGKKESDIADLKVNGQRKGEETQGRGNHANNGDLVDSKNNNVNRPRKDCVGRPELDNNENGRKPPIGRDRQPEQGKNTDSNENKTNERLTINVEGAVGKETSV
ncbi:ileal sodium/bile acid cotransporter-like [Ptychodera flava]|uniref:ileal sodium/bile acid cotransporter-like n=1 Tax=Ptychodera flava TaxID=63121 RepID=UPI003969FA6D